MGHIFRTGETFRIKFDLVQKPDCNIPEEEQVKRYTAAYTKILENYIRQYPDHWFWMHKRWKTKPQP
jgi:lauroyl/myristoyl acyltransferase